MLVVQLDDIAALLPTPCREWDWSSDRLQKAQCIAHLLGLIVAASAKIHLRKTNLVRQI